MQPDTSTARTLTLIFTDRAERERFERIHPTVEMSGHWTLAGFDAAESTCVPKIWQGVYGLTDAEIEKNITFVCKGGERGLRKGPDKLSADLVLCYRVGFHSRMRRAKENFLNSLAAVDKATDALSMITAGLNLAAEAMELQAKALGAGAPLQPPPAPILGRRANENVPPRRTLRPEDFGALPITPR